MSDATPRILATHFENFKHQNVRILGKVTQLRGENAQIDAGGLITILLGRDSHLTLNHAVEIIGKVQQDLTIRVLASTDFGTGVDFDAAAAVVDATHRYKEIFYGDE